MTNPFEHLVDEVPQDGPVLRGQLLGDARRGFVPLRKTFVQRPRSEAPRAAVLADLVHARQERPLDLLLLLHAFQPILDGSPLPLRSWAKVLKRQATPCTSNTASKALDALAARRLLLRESPRQAVVTPLLEDGSGCPWSHPGRSGAGVGPGYFVLPHSYWTDGLVDALTLPGKAMLLIALAETSNKPTFTMPIGRAQEWYGLSERTAERGYQQLRKAGVLDEHRQVVAEPRSTTGLRAVWHRALTGPYSTAARERLQQETRREASRRKSRQTTTGTSSSEASLPAVAAEDGAPPGVAAVPAAAAPSEVRP